MFITIEGPDGSGKTTVANAVSDILKTYGYKTKYTREPGGSEIAEQIRQVVLGINNKLLDDRTEALLFAASRRQHLVETILPALKENQTVICDRYIDSSLAYQGVGRHLGIDDVYNMNLFATDGILPDLTIYLDIDVELGLSRIAKDKSREVNRLDVAAVDFHKAARNGFLQLVEKYPNRIKKIDASKSEEEVLKAVTDIIVNFLKEHV